MKNVWNTFLDRFSYTIINPQFFLKSYEHEAIDTAKKYARGTLVDIGCGRQRYRGELSPLIDRYVGVDHPSVSRKYKGGIKPDILADATMIPLPSNYCNVVLMISVLEHLPDPAAALKEARRILKNKGVIIIITVQSYPLHDSPFDFFRYTRFGLKNLLEKSKFKILKIKSLGNFTTLMGQFFNVFILYKVKSLILDKKWRSVLGLALLLIFSPFLVLSNMVVYLINSVGGDKGDAFSIYNLAVARK